MHREEPLIPAASGRTSVVTALAVLLPAALLAVALAAVAPRAARADEGDLPGATVSYSTRLEMRRVAQEVVLAVYDPVAGRHLLARVNVEPPPGGVN